MGPSAEMLNIRIPISVRLAKKEMLLYQVMKLGPGVTVPFDKPCDEDLDILANNKLIAWGKVVVVEDKYGVMITKLAG